MDGGIAEGGLSMVSKRVARFLTPALFLLLVPLAYAQGQTTEAQPTAEMLPTPPGGTSTQPRGPFPICTEPRVCIKQADLTKYWSDTGNSFARKARQAGIAADVAATNLQLLWSDAWVAFYTGKWRRLREIMNDEVPQSKLALEQANAEYREWCGQAARARAEHENALRECAFEWRQRGLRTEVTKVHHGFSATSEATWYEQYVGDSGEAVGAALVEALPLEGLPGDGDNAFEPGSSIGDFDKWLYGRVTGKATGYWDYWCIAHESPLAGRTDAPVVHCEEFAGPTDWPPVPPTPLGGKVHPGLPEPGREYLGAPGTWE
jgi:hypothetical protein